MRAGERAARSACALFGAAAGVCAAACAGSAGEDEGAEIPAPPPAGDHPPPRLAPGDYRPTEAAPELDADAPPRSVTIAGTGDVLIHSRVYRRAAEIARESGGDAEYDFRPMFDEVKPIFEAADLSICHLEVPISEDNTDLAGFPRFNAPLELADALAYAGFDACSTASNHTLDQGMEGVRATLDALDDAGVAHAGGRRSPEEAQTPEIYFVGDVAVGHISATFSLNGIPRPEPWVVDLLDDDRFEERARAARGAGADIVVASLHWGTEYVRRPNRQQRELGDRLLSEGIVDVILGHHAHVVQPVAEVGGRPLVYGQGNFLSNQFPGCCHAGAQDGVIPIVELTETEDGDWEADISAIPTWVDRRDFTIIDIKTALADPDRDELRETLEGARARTDAALGDIPDLVSGADFLEHAGRARAGR